jgi:predicted dehydrogenase
LLNLYGKDATAYYDLHSGLRLIKRGETQPAPVVSSKTDTLVEQLEEFAAAVRGQAQIEVDGDTATRSLAVVRAGILSARQGRLVEVAEILNDQAAE